MSSIQLMLRGRRHTFQSLNKSERLLFLCSRLSYFTAIRCSSTASTTSIPHSGHATVPIDSSSPEIFQVKTNGRRPSLRERYFRWNWVWGFVILLTLLGSTNINIMRQKHYYNDMERKYNRKIDALETVINKLRNGEEVDVAEELGTGVPREENEWKDLLKTFEEKEVVGKSLQDEFDVIDSQVESGRVMSDPSKPKNSPSAPKNIFL
ncbi:uncharacterized protein V1516DRAFT_676948 [Lipomyces oligophaga]|uniref:uncharacterized protein n=1 Tax=Lipomyces oligophaga TaxID=45792 RepID=UPI0034CEDFBD